MANFEKEKEIISKVFAFADVVPGGSRPWDILVHDSAFYGRVLSQGSMGLGESYMEGMWDCAALDELFFRIMRSEINKRAPVSFTAGLYYLKNRLLNLQSASRSLKLKHYDTGNDLFVRMLDSRMVYTCGYWQNAGTLDAAQEAKLELVCKKMMLKPGMKVLDIGCGWGSFMKYAAEKYGVSCVGVTISQAQVDLGRELCKGLPVEFLLQDYRDVVGHYDAVVSLGMFEHVGPKNHRQYMQVVDRCLADGGVFLLHTIGSNSSKAEHGTDPWIEKYVFPGGQLPSAAQIFAAAETELIVEDLHNFGADYDKTLVAWHENFERAWPELQHSYSETFHRMWRYYLLQCAGVFRARSIQLWQIVFFKKGVLGGYTSVR